jgi:hypothetical protein
VLFVLDTNVLITARDQYYGFDQVPEFWDWLLHQAKSKRIGVPREALDEILDGKPHHGKDLLYEWARSKENGLFWTWVRRTLTWCNTCSIEVIRQT